MGARRRPGQGRGRGGCARRAARRRVFEAACTAAASVTAVVGNHDGGWADDREDGEAGGPFREAALAVGSAAHRILEGLDLARDLPSQVHAAGAWSADELEEVVAREQLATARSRLSNLLSRIEAGGCLRRLGELADRVAARELPLVLPPAPGDPVAGALIGTADLVYAEEGRLVVVDFKTDQLETDDELATRAAHHRPQLERYAAAVQSALALDQRPAIELCSSPQTGSSGSRSVSGIGPSAHAGRRPRGVRESSPSLAGLRRTRAEKDALRASGPRLGQARWTRGRRQVLPDRRPYAPPCLRQ